jgi:hypothetical protein
MNDFADPKPIKFGAASSNLSPMKALPPISAGKKATLTEMNSNFLGPYSLRLPLSLLTSLSLCFSSR